uniref:WLGC domain-containing protein n=1 Tax=Globisporangium ultimum (strain ATCC 200006 / CBS 805.95 / DAOM BR144) TaxID=431595 RepID=K3WG74_GLOUD
MHSLAFIHIAVHLGLRHLPSFRGLANLRSLTLTLLFQLEELPDFTDLGSLERLVLTFVSAIDLAPDMAPLRNLQNLMVSFRGTMCCNGFLNGTCDLNNSLCAESKLWGMPTATCLPSNRTGKLATDATRAVFAKFSSSVCSETTEVPETQDDFPDQDGMAQCNGVMYCQCVKPGNRIGMCYNPRMMALSCDGSILPIAMRKRQIKENVGEPRDPIEEV